MHQIERVGVVALLFLIVTIVTVALWDDGGGDTVRAAEPQRGGARPAPTSLTAGRGAGSDLRSVRAPQSGRLSAPISTGRAAGDDLESLGLSAGRGSLPVERSNLALPRETRDRAAGKLATPPAGERERELVTNGFHLRSGANGGAATPTSRKAALEPPPAAAAAGATTYVVRSGDTLEGIARHTLGDGQRWREIQSANGGLDPRRLRVGQTLRLPQGTSTAPAIAATVTPSTPPATEPAPAAAPPARAGAYVVQKGDVLGTIAQRTLGSSKRWREIAALNPDVDPKKLWVGMELRIPIDGESARAPERALVANAQDREFKVR